MTDGTYAARPSWFADVVDGCTGDPNEALAKREVEIEREQQPATA